MEVLWYLPKNMQLLQDQDLAPGSVPSLTRHLGAWSQSTPTYQAKMKPTGLSAV